MNREFIFEDINKDAEKVKTWVNMIKTIAREFANNL